MADIDNVMAEESIYKKPFNYRDTESRAIFIATIPVSILGFIGNVIVLWLFCCKIKLTNLSPYFLNLTIANLMTSFCSAEGTILYVGNLRLNFALQSFIDMLYVCAYDTNLYIVTALSAERCLTLYFPGWWQHHRPENFSAILCLILWMSSCSLSLLHYFFCFPKFFMTSKEYESQCGTTSIITLITEVVIFPPSMFCFSLAIWIRRPRSQEKPRARLDITIVAITIVILMLNIPTRAALTILFWIPTIDLYLLMAFTVLLDSFCCSAIAIVYLIVGSWKRWKVLKSFHMCFERAFEDTENMPESAETKEEQA